MLANGVAPLCLGLILALVGVGSRFGWIKVRWLTVELFEKSNEAILIAVGLILAVVGVAHLL